MFKKILNNRNLLALFLSLFIFLVIFILSFFDVFYSFDKNYQDFTYKIIDSNVSKDLIIIEIDDNTLGKLGYPLDRKSYIPFIENLTNAGVPIIGFDIIFSDKSNLPDSDIEFAKTIRESNNIILGLPVDNKNFLVEPYSLFKDNIINSGYLRANIDPKVDKIYSIIPMSFFNGQNQSEQFSISILKSYYSYIYGDNYNNEIYGIRDNNYYITPKLKIPLSRSSNLEYRIGNNYEKEILINYVNRDKFTRLSFYDIYNKNIFEELKKDIDFENKIILVGFTAKGIKDVFNTPNGKEYGVYTHANMINTALTKSFLTYFDKSFEWILICLLIIVSVYFNLSRSGFILLLSNFLILIIFIIIYPLSILLFTNLLINYPIELIFSLLSSFTLTNFIKYIIENKDKRKLNQALSEYVSVDIAHEILSGEGKINLNGEEKNISILFSDIQGFTSISEKLKPAELVGFLRIYLSKMSDIIIDELGFINKYEGDSIMALWGVFKDYDNDSIKSCLSAIKQQRLLKELNKEWSKIGFGEVKIRIGIHTGVAIIGNIGSKGKKLEFTALGDSVNLASRLEGVNKFYGTGICVSEIVYLEAKQTFDFRYLDKIKVKGKNIGIKIYELIEEKTKTNLMQIDITKRFENGIGFYLNRQFDKALEIFSSLEEQGDKPSITYVTRCKAYLENPPGDDWDGIWIMENK